MRKYLDPLKRASDKLRAPFIKPRTYDELPKIKHRGGYSIIRDAVVGLDIGLHPTPCIYLVKECCKYDSNVFFEAPGRDKPRVSGKSIMGLISLEAEKGSRLDIFVQENPGENPDKLALRLYAGITTRGEEPDFDRLKLS